MSDELENKVVADGDAVLDAQACKEGSVEFHSPNVPELLGEVAEESKDLVGVTADEVASEGLYFIPDESTKYHTKKVSNTKARFYLAWQSLSDVFRTARRTLVGVGKSLDFRTGEKVAIPKKAGPMGGKTPLSVAKEREKLYNQFLNHLILLFVNGIVVGGLLLAAVDYILRSEIPERSPLILAGLMLILLYCLGYWTVTYKRGKGVEGVRGLAAFAIVICMLGSVVGGYGVAKNITNLNTYYAGERIVIKDKIATASMLESYIDVWRHTPNYSLVRISDTAYYAVVYNSKGESIAQLVTDSTSEVDTEKNAASGTEAIKNVAFTLADGTAVVVTEDTIERRKDVDNLKYVELALQWVGKGKASIDRLSSAEVTLDASQLAEDAMPGTQYVVSIKGYTKIKEFYATVLGSAEADAMLKSLFTTGNNVTLLFSVSVDQSYLGVSSTMKIAEEESLLWYIDNYTEVYDWSLGTEDWYKYDFADAKKNEKMVQEALYNATSMLDDFGLDKGLTNEADETDENN